MRIKISFQETRKNFTFSLAENKLAMNCRFEKAFMPEPYIGEYEVTPAFTAQTLPTRGKTMINDLVIDDIPVSEVSNPQDGLTVTIGV